MTIAKRVRDFRYAKGWGPDELASRADISRTALYQIECGKTETPRAGTLRRIAEALDVSIETLLGNDDGRALDLSPYGRGRRDAESWDSNEGAPAWAFQAPEPLATSTSGSVLSRELNGRLAATAREVDLQRKFHDLLASPMGESFARIIEEAHNLLPTRGGKQTG